jgi:hypothetical protein
VRRSLHGGIDYRSWVPHGKTPRPPLGGRPLDPPVCAAMVGAGAAAARLDVRVVSREEGIPRRTRRARADPERRRTGDHDHR